MARRRRYRRNKGGDGLFGIPMWMLLAGGGVLVYLLISKGGKAAQAAIESKPAVPTITVGGVTVPQSTAVAAAQNVLSTIQSAVA